MKVVEKSSFPGWNNYPVYMCKTFDTWHEINTWCRNNGVETFIVSSGANGYQFQVRTMYEWFVMRWS